MESTRKVGPIFQQLMGEDVLSVVVIPMMGKEMSQMVVEVIEMVVRVIHQTRRNHNTQHLDINVENNTWNETNVRKVMRIALLVSL